MALKFSTDIADATSALDKLLEATAKFRTGLRLAESMKRKGELAQIGDTEARNMLHRFERVFNTMRTSLEHLHEIFDIHDSFVRKMLGQGGMKELIKISTEIEESSFDENGLVGLVIAAQHVASPASFSTGCVGNQCAEHVGVRENVDGRQRTHYGAFL